MQRRVVIRMLCGVAASAACVRAFAQSRPFPPLANRNMPWHQILEPERFDILFREETEFAGSSPLNDEKRSGTYICAACYLPLFASEHKYDSGTGWPSFTQPIEGHIATREDRRGREPVIEYHCARCGGHQGHVFDDGPPPRGERWCNNGLAVEFIPKGAPLPALRG
jgi:peptide-methionine (R)-S-oxide reductase